jgi:hypothetical protein
MTAFGASFPFPLALVQVGKLNGHRPFSQGGGNGSKCPKAAIRRSIEDRVCRVGKLPLVAPLQTAEADLMPSSTRRVPVMIDGEITGTTVSLPGCWGTNGEIY